MGAAQSSNVADVATNMGTTISNSTVINQEQTNSVKNTISMDGCKIEAQALYARIYASSRLMQSQITRVSGNNQLVNTVAQTAMQSAASKVGSLGIGYASANNSVNMLCNVTNNVIQKLTDSKSQTSLTNNSISCYNSTISVAGVVDFSINSITDMTQTLILRNSTINNISNSVSQSVKQTATATVEGIGGALICIAILIIAIGWSFGNVATSTGSSIKPLIVAAVAFLIGFIIFLAWYNSWGPFFNKLVTCTEASGIGRGGTQNPCNCLINNENPQNIKINTCPLKYTFPLFNKGDITAAGNLKTLMTQGGLKILGSNVGACLFDLACISGTTPLDSTNPQGSYNNAGYTIESLQSLKGLITNFTTLATNAVANNTIKNPTLVALINLLATYSIPNLLTDPGQSLTTKLPSGTYIKIPAQYQWQKVPSGGGTALSNTDANIGLCTPSVFTWDNTKTIDNPDNWSYSYPVPNDYCRGGSGSWTLTTDNKTQSSSVGLANSNKQGFITWINTISTALYNKEKAGGMDQITATNIVCGFVRTLLTYILNINTMTQQPIDNSVYIIPEEMVIIDIKSTAGQPAVATAYDPDILNTAYPKKIINYVPDNEDLNFLDSWYTGGGSVKMIAGVCKNKDYEIHQFMQKIGNWLILLIIIAALIFIWRI